MTRRKISLKIVGVALPLLLLMAVLVTACGGTPSTSTANTVSATPTSGATTTPTKGRGISKTALAQSLDPYMPAIKQQLAQGLHLTVTQLTQKIQAGQTLTAIASAQGLSPTQLSTLIANAVSTSLAPLVQSGKTTQRFIDKLTRRLQQDPNLLDTVLAQ